MPPSSKSRRGKEKETGERPWEHRDLKQHPKQRIFLSIDAIGSTKFKSFLAEKGCSSGVWASGFSGFLSDVLVRFREKFVETARKHCRVTCKHPCVSEASSKNKKASKPTVNVWKYIGDEVVLMAELTCGSYQPSQFVLALAETVKYYNRDSIRKKIWGDLANPPFFKGTAWVAGFPVTNVELDLPGPTQSQEVKDFLGPSMDLGFRLSKFASKDRLIVSASLAYFIVHGRSLGKKKMPLCFGGLVEAKGVRGDKHPLIWYPLEIAEDTDLCRANYEDMQDFLNEYLDPDSKGLLPFILNDRLPEAEYDDMYKAEAEKQEGIPYSPFYLDNTVETSPDSDVDDIGDIVEKVPPRTTPKPLRKK